ncbi:MAG: DUF4234 domain-containing protein [Actinomycetota bacterium]|nr:DUF4234 domain-containing protein [Actinomycetota bacterium]
MDATATTTGPLGQPRGILFGILMFIVTIGIYSLYWTFKTYEEIKQHSGVGLGGVVGLVIWILLSIVTFFELPSEVGQMYRADAREAPVTGWTGLWALIPIVGHIIWFVKVQGALNAYWQSKGFEPAEPAPAPLS